jgi:hypothetical protein
MLLKIGEKYIKKNAPPYKLSLALYISPYIKKPMRAEMFDIETLLPINCCFDDIKSKNVIYVFCKIICVFYNPSSTTHFV